MSRTYLYLVNTLVQFHIFPYYGSICVCLLGAHQLAIDIEFHVWSCCEHNDVCHILFSVNVALRTEMYCLLSLVPVGFV